LAADYLEKLRGHSDSEPYACDLVWSEFCQLFHEQDSTRVSGRLYDLSINILYHNSNKCGERAYLTGVEHALQPSLPSGMLTFPQTEDV
jgi:hypothetical protein